MVGDGVTVRERGGKEGETVAELTAVAVGVEAGSGTRWRRRIDGDGGRSPRRKTMAWRRCRASRGAWLGGEEEGVEAELLSSAEGRGVAGGYGCDDGALRWLSVVLQIEGGRELERAGRKDSGRGRLRGVARGLGEEAGGGQGKQEVAEAASAPVGHARCLLARGRRQEKGVEMGWAGWAALEELGQVSGLR